MRNRYLPVMPTRREAVRILSAAAAGAGLGGPAALADAAGAAPLLAAFPPCVVVPQQTEGPYFVDTRLKRADIREDPSTGIVKPGLPLTLAINVTKIEGAQCSPLTGAMVDVWQCDAAGEYSDVSDRRLGFDTRGRKFLRGYQETDQDGRVLFTTIYPGWYPGRTVHIHFKIRTGTGNRAGEFTSQWYFDDAVTDQVLAAGPYAAKGPRSTRNDRDGIYRRGGRELMLNLAPAAAGYAATFDIGLRLSA
jgi:protocatechuate 3,4-dioxygenase beta subunit